MISEYCFGSTSVSRKGVTTPVKPFKIGKYLPTSGTLTRFQKYFANTTEFMEQAQYLVPHYLRHPT